jgi:invasion protein IalB
MGRVILTTVGGFLLGAVAVLGVTNLLHSNKESTTRVYDDWRLNCPPAAAKASACTLTQDLVQNGTGNTMIHIEFGLAGGEKRLAVIVPHGVLLQPGLGLGIGSAPLRVLKYETCDQVGCVVVLPLDDEILDALEDADDGRIVIVAGNGEQASFPYSLRGFKGGMRMLGWEAFRRSSWFGRQLP